MNKNTIIIAVIAGLVSTLILLICISTLCYSEDIEINSDPNIKASDIGIIKADINIRYADTDVVIIKCEQIQNGINRTQYSINYSDKGLYNGSFMIITDYLVSPTISKIIVKRPLNDIIRNDVNGYKTHYFKRENNVLTFSITGSDGEIIYRNTYERIPYNTAITKYSMPNFKINNPTIYSWNSDPITSRIK